MKMKNKGFSFIGCSSVCRLVSALLLVFSVILMAVGNFLTVYRLKGAEMQDGCIRISKSFILGYRDLMVR